MDRRSLELFYREDGRLLYIGNYKYRDTKYKPGLSYESVADAAKRLMKNFQGITAEDVANELGTSKLKPVRMYMGMWSRNDKIPFDIVREADITGQVYRYAVYHRK